MNRGIFLITVLNSPPLVCSKIPSIKNWHIWLIHYRLYISSIKYPTVLAFNVMTRKVSFAYDCKMEAWQILYINTFSNWKKLIYFSLLHRRIWSCLGIVWPAQSRRELTRGICVTHVVFFWEKQCKLPVDISTASVVCPGIYFRKCNVPSICLLNLQVYFYTWNV